MTFNFLKYKWIGYVFCIFVLVAFAVAYVVRGGFNYSVDFTGGTELLFRFEKPIKIDDLRSALEKHEWQGLVLREFSSRDYSVRIRDFSNDLRGLGEKMKAQLQADTGQQNIEILKTDSVGKGPVADITQKSILVIVIALLFMTLYVALRFRFAYSVGALVCLFHDAIAICAFFLVFNFEFSADVIVAILTILGYSINDTIVIFSRMRENLNITSSKSPEEVANASINQTLSRTILTSFATSLVVLSLLVLGGESLRGLSMALLVGIIVGTYSSIFVASPVMLWLYKPEKV